MKRSTYRRAFRLPWRLRGPAREFHVSGRARARYGIDGRLFTARGTLLLRDLELAQRLAQAMNDVRQARLFPEEAVRAGDLYAAGLLDEALHLFLQVYRDQVDRDVLGTALARLRSELGREAVAETLERFVAEFPNAEVARGDRSARSWLEGETDGVPHAEVALEELLMLHLANDNPACERFRELFDDDALARTTAYPRVMDALRRRLRSRPGLPGAEGTSLYDLLRAPIDASPTSLEGQLGFVRTRWGVLLGERFADLMEGLLRAADVVREERKSGLPGPGPLVVPEPEALRIAAGAEEYEHYSPDQAWMPRVVLLAKSTYVWLDQLSRRYGRDISRLDAIPDEELDELAARGFTGLWLIGLWQRSEASREIKNRRGQPDAVASAYALFDYVIADDLGGRAAYENLRDRAWRRGIRLASDMVPNHVGIDGRWVLEHPDWFVQLDRPPYPGYRFEGPDLSSHPDVAIRLEDHYWDSTDAAVVFQRTDVRTGETRYLYHGNDGTSMPWNDTAQLDYLNPEVREAVIQTILHVARQFPVIRFDAAMTLAKRHVQRLWYPEPGHGGAVPSRAQYGSMPAEEFERRMPNEFWREVVDRVAREVPDTLLLAEAFWMMEGYFVRTLGMHRVYNSAFMHMLKREDNAEYRQLMKTVLEFDGRILGRYVNFMNNPDEDTAIAQFGDGDKYFAVATLLATLPGLPMFGHGQVEGYTEKYGMEYRRAKLDEAPNEALVARHRREIFPLLHRRAEFAGVDGFLLYDLHTEAGGVDENVFAYSNRQDGRASLVIVHNRYGETSGWIRESVAYTRPEEDGEELERQDLFTGLGLQGGEGRYLILREPLASRETLVRSDELRERGLYVALEAYDRRVFLDLEEVRTSAEEPFGELAAELAGRAVPSVREALAERRLRPLHEAMLELLQALPAPGREELARVAEAGRDHRFAWTEAQLAEARTRLAGLGPLRDALRWKLGPLEAPLRMAALLASHEEGDPGAAAYRRLRLDRPLARAVPDGRYRPEELTFLPPLLLRHAPALAEGGEPPELDDVLERLDEDEEARAFLELHEHAEVRYFRQERYRLLLDALVAGVGLELLRPRPEAEGPAEASAEDPAGGLAERLTALRSAAADREADSGYRWERLLGRDRPLARDTAGETGTPGPAGEEAEALEAEDEELPDDEAEEAPDPVETERPADA